MAGARRRGRPSRAGERATHRIEVLVTADELAAIRLLADSNQCSIADTFRLGILTLAEDLAEGADPPVVLGGRLATGIFSR